MCVTVRLFISQETQRKYGEYRELSSSLHVWIRDSMAVMQDRQFPNTLIEVKKLAAESNRFRTEEIPHRLREKQHVSRLYKEIEVALCLQSWNMARFER